MQIGTFIAGKLNPPADTKPDFSNQTIIVTGSNTGLGYEAALKFVQGQAAKVVLAVRSPEKGEAAKSRIEQLTGRKNVLEVWQLDMLDYDSIQAFADRANNLERVDVALLNAGVFAMQFEKAKYGFERTLQVNVLSTVLLALLLLPKLKQSSTKERTAVLELVGSGTHKRAFLKDEIKDSGVDALEAYNTADGYTAQEQYGISKLFVQYAIQQLASMTMTADGKPEVVVLSVCPGACQSELSREMSGPLINVAKTVFSAIALRTTEQGARTFVSGAALGEKSHGKFWQNDQIQEPVSHLVGADGKIMQEKAWHSIVAALEKDVPAVRQLVADV